MRAGTVRTMRLPRCFVLGLVAAHYNADALAPFVVVSLARSGTTWLMSLLNQHPRIHARSEMLLHSKTAAESEHLLAAFDVPGPRPHRRPRPHLPPPKKKHQVFVRESPRKAVGFKFFDGQGGESLDAAAPSGIAAWLRANGAKVVVLERQGLARLVSQVKHRQAIKNFDALEADGKIAAASERFKCGDAACVDRARARRVTLNASDAARRLEAQFDEWAGLLAWTRAYKFADVQYHTYRDLSRDAACEMNRIYAFLGVGAFAANGTTTTLKMGGATPRADIQNADEVAAALRGTRWEGEVDRRYA